MTTYRIPQDVRHEYANADGTIVTVELKAGNVDPSTEADAVAVAHLIAAGLADEAPTTTKKKADAPADVTPEEI